LSYDSPDEDYTGLRPAYLARGIDLKSSFQSRDLGRVDLVGLGIVDRQSDAATSGLARTGTLSGCRYRLDKTVVAARLLKSDRMQILRERWIQSLLGPVSSALYLANLVLSVGSRRLVWRGIGYEMISRGRNTDPVSSRPR
jgi:hypothetical protein